MAPRADDLLVETIDNLLADHCAPERVAAAEAADGFDAALWSLLEDRGLTLVGVPEDLGGSGGTLADAVAVVKAAGHHAAPVPLGDTFAAAQRLVASGEVVPAGPLTIAWRRRIPWGTIATAVDGAVGEGGGGRNAAGEPWIAKAGDAAALSWCGALARSAAMVGALHRVVELSVQYVGEREQFGRPIGRFQALQHYLVEMAGEAAAAEAAVDTAVDVLAAEAAQPGPAGEVEAVVGAAKAYAGRAVATCCRLAHQIHGAIGFTDEHRLQLSTRRLWAWRDEHGSEAEWAARLGGFVVAGGGDGLWPTLTSWPRAAD